MRAPRPNKLTPDVVRLVRQSGHHADCGVASLAMLAGVMYEDALAAFRSPLDVLKTGVSWPRMHRAAKRLGVATRVRRTFDVNEATGILNVIRKEDEHLVFLWAGRIVDGNGEMWIDPADYFKHYNYEPKGLLVRTDVVD